MPKTAHHNFRTAVRQCELYIAYLSLWTEKTGQAMYV